jgi:hypothetical protein
MARNKDGSVTIKTPGKTAFTPKGSQVGAAKSGPGVSDARGGKTATGNKPVGKSAAN